MPVTNELPAGYEGKCEMRYVARDVELSDVFPSAKEALEAAKCADDEIRGGCYNVRVSQAALGARVTHETAVEWMIDSSAGSGPEFELWADEW